MSEAKPGGLDRGRLLHLKAVVEEDIHRGLYLGGVLIVARHGEVGLYEALGHADEARTRAVAQDSVFSIFSVTKAFTNVLVFQAIEQGRLAFTTPISSVIPEFSGRGREAITLFHLLTHTSGIPSLYTPREGMCIDRLSEVIQAICDNPSAHPVEAPGTRVDYSPMVNHALLGEAVRRTDTRKRRYRQILEEEILRPLKMGDTSVGLRRDLRERHLVPEFRGNAPMNHLGHSNLGPQGAFLEEEAEMPWVGLSSTTGDMFRFAEALRRGGELDGVRILGPTILERARQCWTGDKPNEVYKRLAQSRGWKVMPAYIGLGFSLRGVEIGQSLFGTLTSPHTFGNYGAGSTLFWVDPALEMTFVALTTGVMSSGDNIERWRRLSDIAVSAAV
ncbi:MAG TPA: serine hydrolase domain-containing protein [Steroidobacteraceae bacterium]|nr:serine hydrolase domain-containing protein [Steroidobacteraceae bacterium]